MQDGIAAMWRQTLDRHHTALVDELSAQMDSEIESRIARERERAETEAARELQRLETETASAISEARARAAEESRLRLSESLNQSLRRIRQTSAEHETLQLLLGESPATRAVVLLIENGQARLAAWRNVDLREEDSELPIELNDTPALKSCVDVRDPMVALATPAEISPLLATALNGAAKVYLFPVVVRQITVAVMMACGDVAPAPIELLSEAAGMKLESFEVAATLASAAVASAASAPVPELVQIAGGAADVSPAQADDSAAAWSKLSAAEQALHLRAQRTARVRVAQMRVSEFEALRKGMHASDVYSALRPSIDAARDEYRRLYLEQSPTMVDYLHLEILRSLARDDSRLMGREYPGPIDG